MLRNWLTLSLRRFSRNKANSFINIFGLALGMSIFLLIFLYVKHEFSYDNFHKDSNRIFRLIKQNPPAPDNYNGISRQAVLPAPLADVIREQIPGVQNVARLANWGTVTIETEGKTFQETSYFAADADLFHVLTFNAIDGSVAHTLEKPYTVAISESTAIKYFGTTKAVGKTIEFSGFTRIGAFTVDLVFEDFPTNSSYQFNIVLRFVDFVKAVQASDLENWNNYNYNFLLKTQPDAEPTAIAEQVKQFFIKKYEGSADGDAQTRSDYLLSPLTDSYLKLEVNFSNTPSNDINRLYMLATIAIFVLVVAGINYVNLTTARAVKRAKEIGIRKVAGAYQGNLVAQFLVDALLISFVSMLLAVLAIWLIFPWYRDFIGKALPLNLFTDPFLFIGVPAIPLLLGVAAGIYPAFVLSSFRPIRVLKGDFAHSRDGNTMRDVLTVVQFAISGGLIIAVFIIGQQLRFIENHDPGYAREHILRLPMMDEGVRSKRDVFIEKLRSHPSIIATSVASYFPNAVNTQQGRNWVGPGGTTEVSFYTTHADHNYVDLFDIKIVKGRNFLPDNPADRNAFLINETACKTYGWEDPIGMQFTGETGGAGDTVRIIGVIKDIHIASYRRPIVPFRIGYATSWSWQLAIKIRPDDIPATLAYIEEQYKNLATTKIPFSISFFDEDFGKVYKTDRQLGRLINIFSIVAVLIACLGLYGLAVHTVGQRLKEVGIRKILGAGVAQLTLMLSRKFITLVVVAFVIAAPVAYYVMDQWLQGFAYHVEIGGWAFLATIVAMVLVCLATVGSQTWHGATANPSEILRSE